MVKSVVDGGRERLKRADQSTDGRAEGDNTHPLNLTNDPQLRTKVGAPDRV